MMRRIWYIFIAAVVIVLFAGTFAWDGVRTYFINKFFANQRAPVATVTSAKAIQQSWQASIAAIGTTVAVKGVDITPRVSGQVSHILFHSGDMVTKGAVLVQLDDRSEQTALRSAEATLANNQLKYTQQKRLYKTGATAETDMENALMNLRTSKADTASAKLNLQYMKILAPFDGKLGIRKINVGQFLQAGTTIVSLQQLNPIYVDFSLAERELPKLALKQVVKVQVDAYPSLTFLGEIVAISPQINTSTRTILVRAAVKNSNDKLLPGGFANVKILLPLKKDVITVPLTAVTYSLFGNTLYVVTTKQQKGKKQLVATQRIVSLGERQGDRVIVTKGLKNGEEVVSSGQLKLHNGSVITINNKVKL